LRKRHLAKVVCAIQRTAQIGVFPVLDPAMGDALRPHEFDRVRTTRI
jgi:hypothetical protein